MLRTVGQFIEQQGLALAGLACLICLVAASTAVRLLASRPNSDWRQQAMRLAGATIAFSIGAWAAHFIGLLGINAGVPFGFDISLCALSLILVLGTTASGFALGSGRPRLVTALSGLLLFTGITAMHVVGMHAVLLPGRLDYSVRGIAVSMSLGLVLIALAAWLLSRGRAAPAALAMTAGTLSIDLLGMASVRLVLATDGPLPPQAIPHPVLVATISAVCVLILLLTMAASLLDQRLTRRLATEAQRFRMLADATFEGLVLERYGCIIDANRVMAELTGLPQEALVGRTLAEVIPGLCLRPTAPRRAAEAAIPQPDGTTRPVEVLWRDNPGAGGHVIAVRDLSRQKAAESLIDRLARLDQLTGLLNREAFEQQVQAALLRPNKPLAGIAVLHLAIERLDLVTELAGSAAAEAVLVQLARRLNGIVRQTDFVGRLSRDEFAVLQTATPAPIDATAMAERILAAMTRTFSVGGQSAPVHVSIGIATHPADGSNARELMRHAALAAQRARRDGMNRWRSFDAGLGRQVRERQALRRDLHSALSQGQFTLDYQPIVDAMSLDIAGYEALLRWNHPERGRVPPADFIPAAEESGLIVPIGNWVLATACAEAASWRHDATIAVNLSPAQFGQPDIVASVSDVLRCNGLPPQRLELEITEAILMEDKDDTLDILTALKNLGVRLVMDDFGTGYSSLNYLRRFPFDKIKIDRSFVQDVERDAEADSIVRAIIAMGMGLRLKITAEGVENRQQFAMLRSQGCNFLQGYLLGRPRSAAQIEGRSQILPRIMNEMAVSDANPRSAMPSPAASPA